MGWRAEDKTAAQRRPTFGALARSFAQIFNIISKSAIHICVELHSALLHSNPTISSEKHKQKCDAQTFKQIEACAWY
jgi:hypothetical protein